MAMPTSGAISVEDFNTEAGAPAGTQQSLDSMRDDIRLEWGYEWTG